MGHERTQSEDCATPCGPSEEEIVELLEGIRPLPGDDFYDQMEKTPWKTGRPDRRPRLSGFFGRGLLQSFGAMLAAASLVALGLLATPLHSFASELLGFFVHADSDELTLDSNLNSNDYNLGRGWQLPLPPSPEPMNIERAEALAGIQVRLPSAMPRLYRFEGAYYLIDNMSVQLAYVVDGQALLTITELPASRVPATPVPGEVSAVGASAAIEQVRIGEVPGEYVRGGWALDERQPSTVAVTEEESPGLQVVWDPDAAMQTLRWQEGYMFYEISLVGGRAGSDSCLGREDLVMIARSLR